MPRHVDEYGRGYWTYVYYIVELDETACSRSSSPCGGTRCGKTPVYVGQTARSAEERFEQHKAGYKASRWVRDFGLHLLSIPDYEFPTKAAAIEAERLIADEPRRGDFCVYGGH